MIRPLICLALILAAPLPALAHKLKVFAAAEGDVLVGTVYFAGGGPAVEGTGRVTAGDGSPVAEFRPDAEGGFRVKVPARQDYTVSVDAGDGHVAQAVVPAAEFSQSLPAGGTGAAAPASPAPVSDVEAAVARQIRPLRQQIDALDERARFSDIMGGIGTIFGLFGVGAWIAARRGGRR